jgi:hypothetical protein
MKSILILLLCFTLAIFPAIADENVVVHEDGLVIVTESLESDDISFEFSGEDQSVNHLGGTKTTYFYPPKEGTSADHIAVYESIIMTLTAYSPQCNTPQLLLQAIDEQIQPPHDFFSYTYAIFNAEDIAGVEIMFSDMIGVRVYVDSTQEDIVNAEIIGLSLLVYTPYQGGYIQAIETPLQIDSVKFQIELN